MKKKKIKKSVAKKDECFVIMPFSEEWSDDYYSEVYSPAIEKAGMTPRRADDLFAPNNVVEDIWKFTQKAKIILADLTGKNPNVFYELGLAHAIAKPVILITRSEEDIPFDLRAIRILKYDKNKHDWGEQLGKSITQSIKEVIMSPEDSVPAPFLKASKGVERKILTKTDKELIELKQDIALMKKELQTSVIRRHSIDRHSIDIGPDRAKQRIRRYIKRGMSQQEIIERVLPLGPPASWIRETINELKDD